MGEVITIMVLFGGVAWFIANSGEKANERVRVMKKLKQRLKDDKEVAELELLHEGKVAKELKRWHESFKSSITTLKLLERGGLSELEKRKLVGRLQLHHDTNVVGVDRVLDPDEFFSFDAELLSDYLVELKFRGVIL